MSINLRTNEIKDIFSLFDDPLDKYTEIIEFGRKNDSFNDKYKSDSYKIPGCASLAWVYVKKNNSKYRIHTNSEAHIVKGLLYILEYIIFFYIGRRKIIFPLPAIYTNRMGYG